MIHGLNWDEVAHLIVAVSGVLEPADQLSLRMKSLEPYRDTLELSANRYTEPGQAGREILRISIDLSKGESERLRRVV